MLVQGRNGNAGSGFFVNASQVFLVTAKHVIFDLKTGVMHSKVVTLRSYGPDPSDATPNVISLDLDTLSRAGHVQTHGAHDVAVVRILDAVDSGQGHFMPGVIPVTQAPLGVVAASKATLKPLKDILIGNSVITFGYPGSIGLKHVPQLDYDRPLLRKGLIAGTNPASGTIILDCELYPGNSGGPVLEVDRDGLNAKFKIVGVVIEQIPVILSAVVGNVSANSGYSVVAPSDAIFECLAMF